jgi:adenylyltransferase/sulfurtransferase
METQMLADRHRGSSLVQWIGETGRQEIREVSCTVIGCGALGSASSNLLVRSGFGKVKIIDRDFVELSNLERQTLFTEDDALSMRPKALAAASRLKTVNSEIEITAHVTDLNPRNAESMLEDADIVIDGTDNLETRYLINDVCVKKGIPWVHGACLGTAGVCYTVLPEGPCFSCLYGKGPEPGRVPTCDTEGILPSVPQIVGALQASEAIKIACRSDNLARELIRIDMDTLTFETTKVDRSSSCTTCAGRHFEYLSKKVTTLGLVLCGRNAVQITPYTETEVDLQSLEKKLEKTGDVSYKGFLLCFRTGGHELVVFPDGRAIVRGTKDVGVAKSLYSKYIGS